ncbi:hypothetical protein AALO_G00292050 [Alosa alosa]|uniref:Uncharacterized protein n=1 Tax=Alosa alosa TaxID=278164 RepID=A0AAV6FKD1_9TELE|nr:hypothetical protein AALO_G00292050 [Alosa alosa]
MDSRNARKVELHGSHHNQQPPTPSLARRKRIQETTDIRSPTDNMMSPCSRKLNGKPTKDIHTTPHASRSRSLDKENIPCE